MISENNLLLASPHISSYEKYCKGLAGRLKEFLSDSLQIFKKEGLIDFEPVIGKVIVDFMDPVLSMEDCRIRKKTLDQSLTVRLSLHREQGVWDWHLCSLPKMTEGGSFIYKGNERFLVAQFTKSPGVFFSFEEKEESRFAGTGETIKVLVRYAKVEIRPEHGIHFSFCHQIEPKEPDDKRPIRVVFNNKRTAYLLTFLHALGFSEDEISNIFAGHKAYLDSIEEYKHSKGKVLKRDVGHLMQCLGMGDIFEGQKISIGEEDKQKLCSAFQNEIFSSRLGPLGREQLSRRIKRIDLHHSEEKETLTKDDIGNILRAFVSFIQGDIVEDDPWDIGNLKVRLVCDYLDAAFRHWKSWMMMRMRSIIQRERKEGKRIDYSAMSSILSEANKDKISTHFNRIVREWLVLSPMTRILPDGQSNLVEAAGLTRKIVFSGWGGIPVGHERTPRDFHWSHYGRLCPLDTPQSEEVGLSLSLTVNSQINDLGIIGAACHRVHHENGRADISKEIVWVTPWEESEGKYWIAFPDQKVALLNGEKVQAHKGAETLNYVEPQEVGYIHATEVSMFSIAANLIPYKKHNDAVRGVMACSFLRQALPLRSAEPPRIKSTKDTDFEGVLDFEKSIPKAYPFSYGLLSDGEMAFGTELLVGYIPWKGWNFEDAFVISEIAAEKLTEVHPKKVICKLRCSLSKLKTVLNTKIQDKSVDIPPEIDLKKYEEGIIKKGEKVVPGDLLVLEIKSKGAEVFNPKHAVSEGFSGEVSDINIVHEGKSHAVIQITITDYLRAEIGDKLANRHGNKGVISKIFPEHEMPYFFYEDGTDNIGKCECGETKPHRHLELLINPISVISRLNIGQLYETAECCKLWKLPEKVACFDPSFPLGVEKEMKNSVLVGGQYIMKLDHNASDKVHGRSRVPYSYNAFVDQPLKGKKLEGGQRMGEMEVWALMAHNASNIIEEFLTLKSDNPIQRKKLFQSILQGKHEFNLTKVGIPEALRTWSTCCLGLGISLTLFNKKGERIYPLTERCSPEDIVSLNISLLNTNNFVNHPTEKVSSGEVKTTITSGKGYEYYCMNCGNVFHFFGEPKHRKKKPVVCSKCGSDKISPNLYKCQKCKRVFSLKQGLGDPTTKKIVCPDPKCKSAEIEEQLAIRYKFNPECLESEQIFGPLKDYTCACGKYKRYEKAVKANPVMFCERCSTPLLPSYHRRTRMGHIKLARPVPNPFMLAMAGEELKVYTGLTTYECNSLLQDRPALNFKSKDDVERFLILAINASETFRQGLEKKIGGPILIDKGYAESSMLSYLKSKERYDETEGDEPEIIKSLKKLRKELLVGSTGITLEELWKRIEMWTSPLKLLSGLIGAVISENLSGTDLLVDILRYSDATRNICMDFLPVIPPELRLRFVLQNKKMKPHDLNELYRGILIQNAELAKVADDWNSKNEEKRQKYMECRRKLQLAIGQLFCNEKLPAMSRARDWSMPGRPEQYSLSSHLQGKEGIIVGHLLGKRVDFSGRAVIVPDPTLNIDACRIPFRLALKLFRPHLIAKMGKDEYEALFKKAWFFDPTAVDKVQKELTDIVKSNQVLLNRQPTLHRLGMLAFKPQLSKDSVIVIPPLVTKGYNADFDGDQMALYLPVTEEAKREMNHLFPSVNIWHPAHGGYALSLAQDITVGGYLLDQDEKEEKKDGVKFGDYFDSLCSETNPLEKIGKLTKEAFERTTKEGVSFTTADFMQISDRFAGKSGIEAKDEAMKNIIEHEIPDNPFRSVFLSKARKLDSLLHLAGKVFEIRQKSNLSEGFFIGEQLRQAVFGRRNLVDTKLGTAVGGSMTKVLVSIAQNLWINQDDCCKEQDVAKLPVSETEKFWLIVEKMSIETALSMITKEIDLPEGGRIVAVMRDTKGYGVLTDMELETRESFNLSDILKGHPNRKPPRVVGIQIERKLGQNEEERKELLYRRLYGRILAEKYDGIDEGTCIGEDYANVIIEKIIRTGNPAYVRSPLTCKAQNGMCQKCYGLPLTRGNRLKKWDMTDLPPLDTRAGIISAQAVSEPATQMALRKKHLAGSNSGSEGFSTAGIEEVKRCFETKSPLLTVDNENLSVYRDTIDYIYRSNSLRVFPIHFEVLFAGLFQTLRNSVRRALENPRNIMGDATLVQNYIKDREKGCIVQDMKSMGIYKHFGLEEGDIIIEVNDNKTMNAGALLKAFRALRGADVLKIKVIRNNKELEMDFDISGNSGWVASAAQPDRFLDIDRNTLHVIAVSALNNEQDTLEGLKERALVGGKLPSSKQEDTNG